MISVIEDGAWPHGGLDLDAVATAFRSRLAVAFLVVSCTVEASEHHEALPCHVPPKRYLHLPIIVVLVHAKAKRKQTEPILTIG